ncbi:hypothetical protein [Lysobacter sp. HA18]
MKHVASLILVAGLCACSGRPASDATSATSDSAASAPAASGTAPTSADAATAATPASTDTPATADASTGATASTPPPGAQGIAVGEPNPSAPGGLHTPANDPAPSTANSPAHFDGYGDMKFGMTVDQAKKAFNRELGGTVKAGECGYLNPVGELGAAGLRFMFDGGKFARYDVSNDRAVAPGGGRRGMSIDDIRRLYAGRVTETPHKYVDGGKYLKVSGNGGAVVFETDAAGKVTAWHAGVAPQVDYIEGCS